jgi:hypothetical protein
LTSTGQGAAAWMAPFSDETKGDVLKFDHVLQAGCWRLGEVASLGFLDASEYDPSKRGIG